MGALSPLRWAWLPATVLLLGAVQCGGAEPPPPAVPPPEPPPPPPPPAAHVPSGIQLDAGAAEAPESGTCPVGMQFVDTTYCPEVKLQCLRDEYSKENHITICHEFAPRQRCLAKKRRQRFCIDAYEYPNRAGAHPPVMVTWYDAAALCAQDQKRLCRESEWVSACEGPDKKPFPYGYRRDSHACNIDNRWLKPKLTEVYSKKGAVQAAELLRLDQSVASGERADCVSGFGVHDLTGNFDEWVDAEQPHEKSGWAGLKGGAWGHVRNACRPMTTSHDPGFTYYFVSFRCCADAAPDADAERDPTLWRPPPPPDHTPPRGTTSPGWTPTQRGPNRP